VPDIVEIGPPESAAVPAGKAGAPLAARDADVRAGLNTLKSRGGVFAHRAPLAPAAHDLVP
jgi:hypothetical protein